MVGKVFTGNGITRYERGTYDLVGGVAEGFCAAVELSDAVTWPKASVAEPLRDSLLQLCRQRLDGFREQRGEVVFAHRPCQRSPISGSVKERVLTRARDRCECCGARLLLSKPRISGPWMWTPSSPGTRYLQLLVGTGLHRINDGHDVIDDLTNSGPTGGCEYQDGDAAVLEVLLVPEIRVRGDQQLKTLLLGEPNQVSIADGRPAQLIGGCHLVGDQGSP
jgi:hypothetical protein